MVGRNMSKIYFIQYNTLHILEFVEKTASSQVQQILEGRSTRTFIPRTCGLPSCGDHVFKTKQVLDKHR